jgi:hypothetical protein
MEHLTAIQIIFGYLLTITSRCTAFSIKEVQHRKLALKSDLKINYKSFNMCVQTEPSDSIQGSYLSHVITQAGLPNMDYHLSSVDLNYPSLQCVHSNPPVFEINNFLSPG